MLMNVLPYLYKKKMNTLILIVVLMINSVLFDFSSNSDATRWQIVDDVVMGGRSDGSFEIDKNGHGRFSGYVSLENNGGFSSLRYSFETKNVTQYSNVKLRLKGDGKTYQFRIKSSNQDYASFVYEFKTSGNWETIEIPFDQMYPTFRGRRLNIENYPGLQMEQIAFLIGNKKEQSFELLIDKIELD